MAKVLVVYDSRKGFTEKMAEAVGEGAKEIQGTELEMLKVGTPFSISKLDEANGIILGSPTIYGSVTPEMKSFIEAIKEHKKTKKLTLSNKIGGVFGSYGWDGGWVVDKLAIDLENLGIKVVAPPVSVVHGIYDKVGLDEDSLQKCLELGTTIAKKLTS
jgi:NAD(P)H dehydrogenase (quinone)